ncbi:hypothetical protein ACFQ0M_12025 [Kitasatospora aburaviensis]
MIDPDGLRVSVALETGIAGVSSAATELQHASVEVVDFLVRRPSLDDVFLELTGNGPEPVEETTRAKKLEASHR